MSEYLKSIVEILTQIEAQESAAFLSASDAVAEVICRDGLVHVFGCGHSHLPALDAFYRAGGLACVSPLLDEADIAIDCKVPHGDAVIEVGDARMGGLSTCASLFILNSVLIEGAKKALKKGTVPPIYTSGNVEGGTAKNIALEERYFGRIKRL